MTTKPGRTSTILSKAKSKSETAAPVSHIENRADVRGARRTRSQESSMARTIDDLALHDELFAGVLAELKQDIAKGASATDIAKKYAALAQARIATIALTDEDSGRALAASQDMVNRAIGKPTERKQIEHSMAQASEDEIDALLASKLKDVGPIASGSGDDNDDEA